MAAVSNLFNFRLVHTVEKIRRTLGLDRLSFCEILGIDSVTYDDILNGQGEFNLRHLVSLADEVEINVNLIFSGKIDYSALSISYYGGKYILPERYSQSHHQLARVRTINGIVTYLDDAAGPGYPSKLLSRMQIKPALFSDPNGYISPLLIEDFLNELQVEGFQEDQIRAMGVASFWVNRNTQIGRVLSSKQSPTELYRSVHEELISYFDQVWSYRLLSLNADSCLIEVLPRAQSQEIFRHSTVGTRSMCLCRQGVFMSMSGFLGHGLANLTELECMYKNDQRCVYLISWPALNASIKQQSESSLRFF